MKIFKATIASIVFLILFGLIQIIHNYFFTVDVVFYSAIFDGFLAAFIMILLLFFNNFFTSFNHFEKIELSIIWIFLAYILAISVPTVIDRSLSFYILEKLNQRGGAINLSSFDSVFKNEYMNEHRLVDVRITEQINSGTIVIDDKCVKLTERGRKIAKFSLFYRNNLLPKKRLILNEYTDDLTNLFNNKNKETNYYCQ